MNERLRWTVVVPIKALGSAKSRLGVANPADRASLSVAFAQDVVAAAIKTPAVAGVLVVTGDARASEALTRLGALCVPEPTGANQLSALNTAISYGARLAQQSRPGAPVAAIAGDLPALDWLELDQVLQTATQFGRSFVPDRGGMGTTLLAVTANHRTEPRFGAGSAAAHARSGAVSLFATAGPSVRCDVDTSADLAQAINLGAGEHTRAALAASPWLVPRLLISRKPETFRY